MADKKIDESWKDSVEKEKTVPAAEAAPAPSAPAPKAAPKQQAHEHGPDCSHGHEHGEGAGMPPQSDFSYFISTLGMQALGALGEIPDPASGLSRADLPTAHYLIDTLLLLHDKTKGNLTPQEEALLGGILYELQMKFVEKSGAPQA